MLHMVLWRRRLWEREKQIAIAYHRDDEALAFAYHHDDEALTIN